MQFGCSEQPIYELPQSNDLLVSDFCVRVIFDIGLWHQESAYPLHGNWYPLFLGAAEVGRISIQNFSMKVKTCY